MEKRIKIVWILSLLSALVIICVQGYLLYNEYRYAIDTYSEELSAEILKAGEKEYLSRKASHKGSNSFIIQKNAVYKNENDEESESHQMLISLNFNHADSLDTDSSNANEIKEKVFDIARHQLDSMRNASLEKPVPVNDFKRLELSFSKSLSEDSTIAGINRAMVNFVNPFEVSLLDSILSEALPDIRFTYLPWAESDTLRLNSYWEKTGTLLHPEVMVSYSYSPFEKKGIFITAAIPLHPVFKRIAFQLGLSFCLILLLIGCLVFQIKTILKQQKVGELRESFVNTMIHELKRPVQTLKTFISFLGDKELRSDKVMADQIVQDSMFELDNLSAYLTKLKDMVRADSETSPLHIVKFNLHELVEKVIRLINIPPEKKANISTAYEMESPWIEADPVHIANILSNLIENALKYSSEEVEIEIKAKQKGRELWLTVSDNGIGIPYADQEKVFVKFYRGTNGENKNVPGIGLGLSYVKLITEAHRGYVSLTSKSGQGTSVTLYLPQ